MMNVKKNLSQKPIPVIFGVKSVELNKKEKIFFQESNPLGFILFERNCKTYKQTKLLIKNLKKTTSHDYTIIMIDQEGGRVARLKKPHWKSYPSAEYFGIKAEKNLLAVKKLVLKNSIEIAKDLKRLGVNMNCAPVLDVKYDFTNNVIGDRSFSSNPKIVSELGKSFCNGHKKTPNVNLDLIKLNKKDFLPFKKLNNEAAAMVAHIIYNKIDKTIACCSKKIIKTIIRKEIGFKGLLISDDINMKALKGTIKNKIKAICKSGCEIILHCNANTEEMRQIYLSIPLIENKTLEKISKLNKLN